MQVTIDLETTSLEQTAQITTLAIQWSDSDRALIIGKENIENAIKKLADNQSITDYIFHNAQFDLTFMGDYFCNKTYGRIRDTLVISKCRGELKNGLKHLCNLYTSRPGNYSWVRNNDTTHSFDAPEYVTEDIETTWRLFKLWKKEINKPIVQLMNKAVVMARSQSIKGSKLDVTRLDTIATEGAKLVEQLRAELITKYGVDPSQQEKLVEVLQHRGLVFTKKTAKGREALTASVLEEHGLDDILEYRKAMKLDSAFVGKMRNLLRSDGTIPHRQTMLGARTGRTTMNDFNWQQLPRKGIAKELLISRFSGGKILTVDLSQAELRMACYLSNDTVMLDWLNSTDAHKENAAKAFNKPIEEVTDDERHDAKTIVFRSIYGGQPITEGQKRVYIYLKSTFKKLFQWMETQRQIGMRDKRVTDLYGKTVNMLDIYDYKGKWACGRLGINSPVQGMASHMAITITVRAWELFREHHLQSLILFGVHDSLVADIHPDEIEITSQLVQQSFKEIQLTPAYDMLPLMKVLPLIGSLQIADNWGATKKAPEVICSTV